MFHKFELFNINFENHKIYHVTDYEWTKPCHKKIVSLRNERWTHQNSVLGLWCSTLPKLCKGFGKNTFELSIKNDSISLGLTYDDLVKLTSNLSVDATLNLRKYLIDFADVIYILDNNKTIGEIIILNFDSIEKVVNVSLDDVKDIKYKIKKIDIKNQLYFDLKKE